jgi:hypothetical protein
MTKNSYNSFDQTKFRSLITWVQRFSGVRRVLGGNEADNISGHDLSNFISMMVDI